MSWNKKIKNQKAQTFLEYAVLFVVIIGAFIAMERYISRGVQGKWKETIDGMGTQYDPAAEVHAVYTLESNSQTIMAVDDSDPDGFHTTREDFTNSTETKTETITIED